MSSLLIVAPLIVGICAFIGWVTNVVAVKMIFRPVERIRILGPLGWQGVLPRHAPRFARDVANMIAEEFFTLRDLAGQVDAAHIHGKLAPLVHRTIDAGIARFTDELPEEVKESGIVSEGVVAVVKKQFLDEVDRLVPEIRDLVAQRMDSLVDLRDEVVKNLTGANVARLEELMLTVVGKEFRWIEYYGGILGAAFGLVQVGLLSLGVTTLWLNPVIGAVVGLATNWIAIVMLFAPRHPLDLGVVTLQGVFPGRQREIAVTLARVVDREMMKFGELLDLMLARGFGEELRRFVAGRLNGFIKERLQMLLTILAAADVEVSVERITDDILELAAAELPGMLAEVKELAESQIDVIGLVQSSLEDMDKMRFEQILRGLVKQDEPILIGYGGLLGGIIGLVQMALVAALR